MFEIMRKIMLLTILSVLSLEMVKSQNCFQSKTDVNLYLSTNSIFENAGGNKITFSDMGATCNSGNVIYVNPQIKIISSTIAKVSYTCVTISGFSASFTINCKENIIVDLKDNDIYRKGKSVFDKLEDLKEQVYQDRLARYNKYHTNEVFNYLDLNTYLKNDNNKIQIPLGGTFYYRTNRGKFYSMTAMEEGYIINSDLYDNEDNYIGAIKQNEDYYYIDFNTKYKKSPKYRVYINKKDQVYENVTDKRTFTVAIIDLKDNEKYINYEYEFWVDASTNTLNVFAGAIQLIKWHTNILTNYEKIPNQIALDSSYIKSINNNLKSPINFNAFMILQDKYKMIDSFTWSENTNGLAEDNFRWRTYATDSNFLYIQKIMYSDNALIQDQLGNIRQVKIMHYINDGDILMIPLKLKNYPKSSKSYLVKKTKSYQIDTKNWWGDGYDVYSIIDSKPFIAPAYFRPQDCEFSKQKYIEENPEVRYTNIDPWMHFLKYGISNNKLWYYCNESSNDDKAENCISSRLKYLAIYPDVKNAGIDPWYHYNTLGKNQGRFWYKCDYKFEQINKIDTYNVVNFDDYRIPSLGLVGWWPFNGNINDKSGNENKSYDGKAYSSFTDDRFGNKNSALKQGNIYPECSNCSNIDLKNQYSICIWFQHNSNLSNLMHYTIKDNLMLTLDIQTNNVSFKRFEKFKSKIKYCNNNVNYKNLLDGKWHYIVLTFNSKEVGISIDGDTLAKKPIEILTKKQYLSLYDYIPSSISYNSKIEIDANFGNIDDILIYNRELTNQEIGYLFKYSYIGTK
jgi:hypothetical protein